MADNGGRSELAKRLAQPASARPGSRRPRPQHPSGWEPGIDTATGTLIYRQPPGEKLAGPDWSHVLAQLGLSPDDWTVDGDAEVRSWDVVMRDADDQPAVVRAFYHRAKVRPATDVDDRDRDAIARVISRRRPLKRAQAQVTGDGAWLTVVLADWQAGKGTRGGSETLVERLVNLADRVLERRRTLARAGVPVRNLAVLLAGDMVEGCGGPGAHYAMQTFEVDLDDRQQRRLVTVSLLELVDRWAPEFDRITVAAAPGNHGEKRDASGKAFTSWSDNVDLEVVENAAYAWERNPDRYGHVGVLLPEPDDLTVTVELDGLRVGVAHGHQAKSGSGVQKRVLGWWERMAAKRHPIGDVDLLITGHYHHVQLHVDGTHDGGSRTWMQAPALDSGSPWFEQSGGGYTSAGTLTFVAAEGRWRDWHVIPADG